MLTTWAKKIPTLRDFTLHALWSVSLAFEVILWGREHLIQTLNLKGAFIRYEAFIWGWAFISSFKVLNANVLKDKIHPWIQTTIVKNCTAYLWVLNGISGLSIGAQFLCKSYIHKRHGDIVTRYVSMLQRGQEGMEGLCKIKIKLIW